MVTPSREPFVETRRQAADAGRHIYLRRRKCGACGCARFYTSSGQCVDCTKARATAATIELRNALRESKRRMSEAIARAEKEIG